LPPAALWRSSPVAVAVVGVWALARAALRPHLGQLLPALGLQLAQAGVDDRGLDEVATGGGAAAARLRRTQPVDGCTDVSDGRARLFGPRFALVPAPISPPP
jgi:hypothetical protein